MQEHFHHVELVDVFAVLEMHEGCAIQPVSVDRLEFLCLTCNLLESAGVTQAHQSNNGVAKFHDILWLGGQCTPCESHTATYRVEPLASHLVQQPCAFPEAVHCPVGPKNEQYAEDCCCGCPQLTICQDVNPAIFQEAWIVLIHVDKQQGQQGTGESECGGTQAHRALESEEQEYQPTLGVLNHRLLCSGVAVVTTLAADCCNSSV
mmetsp:Transcript_35598/g.83224  ORF Transcript_35598/g.83224 Transcript_35598/m.83224 type:complete len:206 (+) Transcript_35598:1063-1680(+)